MKNKFFHSWVLGLLITLQFLPATIVHAEVTIPAPTNYVVDTADMFRDDLAIASDLSKLAENTIFEVAVVTIPSLDEGETIETTATAIFNDWGIGDAEQDTGLLLLISRDDPEFRIETGYGVEGIITDLEASWYLDELKPYFKDEEYDEGLRKVLGDIIYELTDDPTYAGLSASPGFASSGGGNFFGSLLSIILNLFGFTVIAGAFSGVFGYMAKDTSVWAGTIGGAVLGALGMLFFQMSFIFVPFGAALGALIDWIASSPGGGSGGYSGGSSGGSSYRPSSYSSSSSSSSSGFGGFSGGSSGGGGASGKW